MQLLHSVSVFPSQCRNTMTFFSWRTVSGIPINQNGNFTIFAEFIDRYRRLLCCLQSPKSFMDADWSIRNATANEGFSSGGFFLEKYRKSGEAVFLCMKNRTISSGFQKMSRIPHALKEAAFFWRVPESQGEVFVRFLCMPLSAVLWASGR